MTPCGPWDSRRRVGVAVSGGADSLALAWLTRRWGAPEAFVVDHGLRAESATEAAWAAASLQRIGIAARVLPLHGLARGAGLAARARAARHAVLEQACWDAGLVDLLYGHHAGDQAETVLMRQQRGSGPAGLAGMAAVSEGERVRRVRPLLPVPPGRLRATLSAAGLGWVEDPSNADPLAGRTRARAAIAGQPGPLLASAALAATARTAAEQAIADELAARVAFYPEGYAALSPGPISPRALSALLRTIAGRAYPVGGVEALAAAPRAATLGGARIVAAARLGPGWLVVREQRSVAAPIAVEAGAVWDGRFRIMAGSSAGATLGALGDDAALYRRWSHLPSAVLRTLPAIRQNGMLCHVPHLSYAAPGWGSPRVLIGNASLPAASASFLA